MWWRMKSRLEEDAAGFGTDLFDIQLAERRGQKGLTLSITPQSAARSEVRTLTDELESWLMNRLKSMEHITSGDTAAIRMSMSEDVGSKLKAIQNSGGPRV